MCQGILFPMFNVPLVSYNFLFQKPARLFLSKLCSHMYLLMLFFDVCLNGLYGMEQGLAGLQFLLAFPSLVPLSQIIQSKEQPTNQPAKQQTKQRETQQPTKQKSPKLIPSIPVVWMPFEVMTIVILLTTCSAIPITTFGQTLFRVSSLLLFALLVFNFKSFSSNVSN